MTDTVLAHGVYDVLHAGHLEHLEQARRMGDRLVVSITADRYVNKGPGRPAYTQAQRYHLLSGLRIVDEVFVCDDLTALPAIKRFQPAYYVKGAEYQEADSDAWRQEQAAVKSYGGQVRFTEGAVQSSSRIINTHLAIQHPAISAIRERWEYCGVSKWLDRAAQVEAMVIGECIIDEYVQVAPRWKSAKENLIDYVQGSAERFQGGSWAVQRHAKHFCRDAQLIRGAWPAITKRRYVEDSFGGKLFAVADRDTIAPQRFSGLDWRDLTIVADFGHGLLDATAIDDICSAPTFLALTAQSNGLNWGFNGAHRWGRADYLVLDVPEIRLGWGDRTSDISDLARQEARRIGAKYVVVTQGHRGCAVYHLESDSITEIPALAGNVVDRIGAGDAFLACTASLAAAGAPPEIIGLVGNAAGGLQVGTVGNSQPVTRAAVDRVLKATLA